mmetsp:Transcript_110211/g.275952  ORF Transcript_110211/g.275952 Transcript_110211/m.275952 type:complete len:249 (+) Transcript_110211:241-987(+)
MRSASVLVLLDHGCRGGLEPPWRALALAAAAAAAGCTWQAGGEEPRGRHLGEASCVGHHRVCLWRAPAPRFGPKRRLELQESVDNLERVGETGVEGGELQSIPGAPGREVAPGSHLCGALHHPSRVEVDVLDGRHLLLHRWQPAWRLDGRRTRRPAHPSARGLPQVSRNVLLVPGLRRGENFVSSDLNRLALLPRQWRARPVILAPRGLRRQVPVLPALRWRRLRAHRGSGRGRGGGGSGGGVHGLPA